MRYHPFKSAMAIKPKRKCDRLGRQKETLLKKAHEIAKFCEVDVALIIRICKTGRYITYSSTDLKSWPPSNKHIVSAHRISSLALQSFVCAVLATTRLEFQFVLVCRQR